MEKTHDPLSCSAQYIKGVGPKKIKILNKLGIDTIENLLYYFPHRYEDRSHLKLISQLNPGKRQALKAEVLAKGSRKGRKGKYIVEVAFGDKTGRLSCIWFNQPYMKDYFKVGDKVFLYGKIRKNGNLQIVNPEFEIVRNEEEDDFVHTNRIAPVYSLTTLLGQRTLRKIIYETVKKCAPKARELLPAYIRNKHKLLHISAALKNIHFPKSKSLLKEARRRLIFEEFFRLQLIMVKRKDNNKTKREGISFRKKDGLTKKYKKILPFNLTSSQKKVIEEIEKDMLSAKPMYRLLQGDVGSGKTIVAVYALLLAVENGYQAAFMVPTEILAQQHFSTLRDLLKDLELNIELLTSGFKQKIKEKKKEKIRRHKIDVIVGTHSLIQKDVIFKKLGLVIIDEQHKFGVTQREILKTKSSNPDVLIMTATPIPRTLIYTVYGDLDLSVIDKVPPGRLAVKTWWVSEAKRKGAYDFIRKQIRQGRQAFIVYPLIEESEAINLRAAKKMYDKLKNKVFSEFNVGLIHGQLKKQTKEKIMRKFKEGKTDILVSTIVIEVGIDIPNASCLLIEHAERFGLSQLHQLRGRIGRSNFKSYCILVSSSLTESAKKRLSTMACLNDGFKIAEEDLKLRGPGEFLGTRQHGLPEIRIGDIITDSKILKKARRQAFELIKDDPDLEKDKHQALKSYLHSKMQTE